MSIRSRLLTSDVSVTLNPSHKYGVNFIFRQMCPHKLVSLSPLTHATRLSLSPYLSPAIAHYWNFVIFFVFFLSRQVRSCPVCCTSPLEHCVWKSFNKFAGFNMHIMDKIVKLNWKKYSIRHDMTWCYYDSGKKKNNSSTAVISQFGISTSFIFRKFANRVRMHSVMRTLIHQVWKWNCPNDRWWLS